MKYTWDTILPLGKYKGRKVQDIFNEDVQYLKWYAENVEGSDFDPVIFGEVQAKVQDHDQDYYDNKYEDLGW